MALASGVADALFVVMAALGDPRPACQALQRRAVALLAAVETPVAAGGLPVVPTPMGTETVVGGPRVVARPTLSSVCGRNGVIATSGHKLVGVGPGQFPATPRLRPVAGPFSKGQLLKSPVIVK